MVAPLTLYIVRHGEVYNPQGILYGRMPGYFLSETGREQAAAAGDFLHKKPITAIYASPMQRAQETAQIIAAEYDEPPPIHVEERLNEVHTPYDGTPHEELERINFDLYEGNQPPYEQVQDVRRRVLDFIASIREIHPGEEVVAVTHGDIVVTMFMHAHNQPEGDIGRSRVQPNRIQAMGLPEVYPATASVSRLVYSTSVADEIPSYQYIRPY